MIVCSSTHLYHYLLGGDDALDAILERGLLPLSATPESPRWHQLEAFYRGLYSRIAEPVLKRPFTNSGVFLTPIDFRLLPGSSLAGKGRIAVPVTAIDGASSVLTYELDGQRVVLPLTPAHLCDVANRWPAPLVAEWFGRNPNMLFFHVPQVAAFQEGGIPVRAEWVQPAGAEALP